MRSNCRGLSMALLLALLLTAAAAQGEELVLVAEPEEVVGEVIGVPEALTDAEDALPGEVEEWPLPEDGAIPEDEAIPETPVSAAAKSDFEIVNGVLVKYTGAGGDVVIPKGVTKIGGEAFYRCKTLTSVIIPEGVTKIGSGGNAKDGNPYDDVYTGAFAGCTKLKKVTLPKGLKLIGGGAFYRCKKLGAIDIPNTVRTISSNAFQESGLKSVVIPNSVDKLGDSAFSGCKNLKVATLPRKNKWEGIHLFRDCVSLKSVTVPGGFEWVGIGMFEGCSSLKKAVIEEGPTSLDEAFIGCKSLKIAVIPKSVKEISDEAFYPTKQLTLYGYSKSYAQKYAKAHKIAFVPLDKVTPKATSLKSVSGGKKQITVKWKKVSGAAGYKLQYAMKKNFSDAKTVTVKGAKTISRTIKGLKAKKRYYIRVCAYKTENGETWCSAWSELKYTKTK